MKLQERERRLAHAQDMVKQTMKKIRRLNTSLKSWERQAARHEKAIESFKNALLQERIRELEKRSGSGHRQIVFED